jgi:hypothetical protein
MTNCKVCHITLSKSQEENLELLTKGGIGNIEKYCNKCYPGMKVRPKIVKKEWKNYE